MPFILSKIAVFLASKVGMWIFGGSVLVALIVSFAAHQRSIGYQKAMTKVQETTRYVTKQADNAGRKSQSGSGSVQLRYRD